MGIAENLYAQGYYLYWDLLIERFPNMMIDSCAAGGGRNDIESMRRSVPLHKTDHDYSNQEDKQAMHQTLRTLVLVSQDRERVHKRIVTRCVLPTLRG